MAADFAKRFCYLLILEIATVCKSDFSIETFHFDYSVIEATGKTCPGRDNCKAEVHKNGNGYDLTLRNCFCDDQVRPEILSVDFDTVQIQFGACQKWKS